jgi:hypothetical protein
MSIATKYNPTVSWRTLADNVYQLTRATTNDPATYRISVKAIDTNDIGANQKEIGYFFVDYMGIPFSVIATGTSTIDVQDDFRVGLCPTSGKFGIVFKSVFNGRALYLSQDNFRHLHSLAFGNSRKYDMALLWANDPNTKKIPFTANANPAIGSYQVDQADPEDGTKTVNYASDYGENPKVRCIITVDSENRYERQQMPQFTFVTGLIDTISFDLGQPFDGNLLISK